jgi:hypothetical protein
LFAAFLLGLAMVLATVFIAYLPDPNDERLDDPADADLIPADLRATRFIRWSREVALRRRKWMRASVVALGSSVLFLPAPFVVIGEQKVESVESAIAWPPEPSEPANLQLKKILYTAQVAEARDEKKAPVAAEDSASDAFWWGLFVIALVLVVALPQLPRDEGGASQPGPPVRAS